MSNLDSIRASGNGDRRSRISWTGRLWFKAPNATGFNIFTKSGIQLTFATNKVRFIWQSNALDVFGITFGNWYHCAFGYDAYRNRIFLQVDGGARGELKPFFSSPAFDVPPDPKAELQLYEVFAGLTPWELDEFGFWQSKVWTADETTTDYNGGTGSDDTAVPGCSYYWSMDSFSSTGPNVLTDSISGVDLVEDADETASLVSGKIGNCLQLAERDTLTSGILFETAYGSVVVGG